jgi:hypothetical protein
VPRLITGRRQPPVQAEKMCMGPCGAHHASGNTLVGPNALDTHPFPMSDVSDETTATLRQNCPRCAVDCRL